MTGTKQSSEMIPHFFAAAVNARSCLRLQLAILDLAGIGPEHCHRIKIYDQRIQWNVVYALFPKHFLTPLLGTTTPRSRDRTLELRGDTRFVAGANHRAPEDTSMSGLGFSTDALAVRRTNFTRVTVDPQQLQVQHFARKGQFLGGATYQFA